METEVGSSPTPASFVWGGLNKKIKWWRELLLHPCPEIRPFSSYSYVSDAFQAAVLLWSSKWVCQWVSKWVYVWTLRETPGTLAALCLTGWNSHWHSKSNAVGTSLPNTAALGSVIERPMKLRYPSQFLTGKHGCRTSPVYILPLLPVFGFFLVIRILLS